LKEKIERLVECVRMCVRERERERERARFSKTTDDKQEKKGNRIPSQNYKMPSDRSL